MKSSKEELIKKLKQLPKPLVGSLAFDHKDIFNLRDSCVTMINEIVDLAKPKEILEFGTHLGHSSCLWLGLSDANVTSVDIGTGVVEWEYGYEDYFHRNSNGKGGQKEVVETLSRLYPDRFRFIRGSSNDPKIIEQFSDRKYDFIFIDGGHTFEEVDKDIKTAIALGIPYILVDDCHNDERDKELPAVAVELNKLNLLKDYCKIHNAGNIGCLFCGLPKA